MAEIVVLATLKSLCSVLATTTIEFIGQQFSMVNKVKKQMLDIEKDLKSIQSMLEDADRKMEMNDDPLVGNWVKQVRGVAYELEDIVEKHMYDLAKRGGFDIETYRNFKTSRKTTIELERIKPSVKEILEIYNVVICKKLSHYQKGDKESSSSTKRGLRVFSPTEYRNEKLDDGLFSLDERGVVQKELLEGWILEQPPWISDTHNNVLFVPKCMCIVVWGMGGLGKTTLLEQIFYRNARLRKQFDCLAWITVSKTYTVMELLRELVKKLAEPRKKKTGNKSEEDMIDMIHRIVDQKKYLIVFDDVWQDNFWSKIHIVFRSSDDRHSRILFTTRDKDVALSVARKDRVMQLSHLNLEQAWCLFCKKAFLEENPPSICPHELVPCAQKIVQKCGGVPLAIVTVAGMKFTKERNVLDWERNCSMLSGNVGGKYELRNILMHNYYDLPPHLKQCFLYCCTWPEDWSFFKGYIISLWVAEGFIEERDGMTLEEIGEVYIEELVCRSMMIQVGGKLSPYPRYKIHDILRVIGLGMSHDHKFGVTVDEDHENYPRDARRLNICKAIDEIPNLPKLRTLSLRGIDKLKISYRNFKLLKVLDLKGLQMPNVPREIFQLFNLRYLNLRETGIKEDVFFPSEIERLQNLQVLDICETGVKRLPDSMGKLQKLRKLLCSGVQVPTAIFDLENLQYLRHIKVNGRDLMEQKLGNLTKLRQLGIVEVKQSHEKQLCSSLKRMTHLKDLYLKTADSIDLESLKSTYPRHLQRIELYGAIKGGIPTWFKFLHSLRYLLLGDSMLKEDDGYLFDNLKSLPSLEFLYLGNAFEGKKLSFPSLPYFPSLKELRIYYLKNLTTIEIEDSALPNLRKMEIHSCWELIPPKATEVERLLERLEDIVLQDMPLRVVQHFQKMCLKANVKLTVIDS